MIGKIFLYLFIFIILFYFILWFHELGHSIFALIFTKDKVKIYLGGKDNKITITVSKIILCIGGINPYYGIVEFNAKLLTNSKKALIFLSQGNPSLGNSPREQ